jgi:hypothetical protein
MPSLSSQDVTTLLRIIRKVDGMSGPGIVNTPDNIAFCPPGTVASRPSEDGAVGNFYGKATATWASDQTYPNQQIMHPCSDAAGTEIADAEHVTAYIISPTTATPVGVSITAGDVLLYTLAPDGVAYLLPVKQGGSGGGVDIYMDGTLVKAGATFIKLLATRGGSERYEFVASGDGVTIDFKAGTTTHYMLHWNGTKWDCDEVHAL